MTNDRDKLAESAARGMGWTSKVERPLSEYVTIWTSADSTMQRRPSLDDAAFCWALVRFHWDHGIALPSLALDDGYEDTLPSALAAAVVAQQGAG